MGDTLSQLAQQPETQEQPAIRSDAAREPVKSPEASIIANTNPPDTAPKVEHNGVMKRMNEMRDSVLMHAPDFVVNHSVNMIAALHVGSELMMLKSGGLKFTQKVPGGHPITDPAVNLYRGLRGLDKVGENGKTLQNIWALRSTAVGFVGWVVGLVTPNKKDDSESILEDAELYDRSKVGYVLKRVGEAAVPFKPDHKRQFLGAAVATAGVFSALSGFTSIGGDGKQYLNASRTLGGLVTAVAGGSLWFSMTDRDAWSRFGQALWFRLPFIGMSIHKMHSKTMQFQGAHDVEAFEKANREWKYYAGGAAGFQTAAMVSYLFGGVQKMPDGTIVKTKQQRKEANETLAEKKRIADERGVPLQDVPNEELKTLHKHENPNGLQDLPGTKVAAAHVEAAMPERVVAHVEQQHA